MADELSAFLGGLLIRLTLVGAVVVGMAMALRGEYYLAAGMIVPLGIVVYLVIADAGLLR